LPVVSNEDSLIGVVVIESKEILKIQPTVDSSSIVPIEVGNGPVVLVPPEDVFNPCCDGGGDIYDGPVEEALSARVLQTKLIASETISALRLVYQTSPGEAALADYQNATKKDVVGIALTSATVGNEVVVLYFGRVVDAFFNFPLNDSLFLGNNGIVTNVPPASDYSVRIGKSLGSGAIFINIERPIIL